ncbi:MAG: biopolymer transporter ExbD [Kiritimatiellae bacterium]|nr:biopolymer transporter ExbD [Kiritimatiellia bacterium]
MPRRTTIVALSEIKEINLTPLIDLTFLLLITFIITFPLIEQGVPVNLPRGKAEDLPQRNTRSITIRRDGMIHLDQRSVTLDVLAEEMRQLGAADPDLVVMVRADENVPYGRVAEVLRVLHQAKISKLALVHRAEESR